MFARFRDENALMDPGLLMPGAGRLPDTLTGAAADRQLLTGYRTFVLPDGRSLSWAEFGHRHGYPVLYMHRQGGCRLEAMLLHEAASSAGFRLIAVDRPGLGGSDYLAFDDPAVLASDYIELLDQLCLPKVAILSWGGGSRFALAMAARFPQRISMLNLVSPLEHDRAPAANRLLGVPVRLALRLLVSARARLAARDDARYLRRWRDQVCHADRKQLDDPQLGVLLASIARESTRQGAAGLAQDLWFSLTAAGNLASACHPALAAVPVHIWHGASDAGSRCHHADPEADYSRGQGPGLNVFRHWVRQQGHLFFRQSAADIFRFARASVGVSPVAGGPVRR